MEERTNIRMRLRNGIWQDAIPNFGPSLKAALQSVPHKSFLDRQA